MTTCTDCHVDLPQPRYHVRRFCRPCREARFRSGKLAWVASRTQVHSDRLEDIEWMLSSGESPTQIANRLGIKPQSVARFLYRCNETQLAHLFEHLNGDTELAQARRRRDLDAAMGERRRGAA